MNLDNPNHKKKIVTSGGHKLEVIKNSEYKEDKVLTFFDWVANTLDHSAQAAWNYKQGEINALIKDWNYSVCWGKERLKETIDNITLLNATLKAKVNKLEGENQQLKKEIADLAAMNK